MNFASLGMAKASLKYATTPWAVVTSVVGFTCDVLKPSGNLAPYLLVVSALGLIAMLFFFRKRAKAQGLEKTFNSPLGGFLSFFALSTIAWTGLTLIFMATPPEGVAAAVIPGLEDFQKQVLKIGQDVTEIKGTVGRIEEKIDALALSGTVIPNPKTPEEFYHNARFYELKGNTGEAQRAYEKFLELAPAYVDVHMAYQTLMNNTQGIEATRQVYARLQTKHPDQPIVELMASKLISDRAQRMQKLETLAQRFPSIGPLRFELFKEYSSPGQGNVTIDEMKSAKQELVAFQKADELGAVNSFYIDKKVLEQVYRQRDEYLKVDQAVYGQMIDRPITIQITLLPNMVGISLLPKEQKVQKLFYSIDDPNPTIDTGPSPWLKDPATGQPMPNMQVSGKIPPGKHVLYTKYINSQGKESPVYSEPFEVTPIKGRITPMPGAGFGTNEKNIVVDFQSVDGKSYEFYYSLGQPNPDKRASGETMILEKVPANSELFFYGMTGGQKTPVYSQKIP